MAFCQIQLAASMNIWNVQDLFQFITASLWVIAGDKAAGKWRQPYTQSSAGVKERVEL